MNAQHSSATPEHGTPFAVVEAARAVLGAIDLDPASSGFHNDTVRASAYYTAEDDGLKQTWPGRVLVNPPGSRRGVKEWWVKLQWEVLNNRTSSAIWIGFSVEQLISLQRMKGVRHPLQHPTCIPSRRLRFGGANPTHGNYITYIGPDSGLFARVFGLFGLVILPTSKKKSV